MAQTYTPIATTTLGSSVATYTFSSIPSTYTDLVFVVNMGATAAFQDMTVIFNGDTAANYSFTRVGGNGSTTASARSTGASNIRLDGNGPDTVITSTYLINVMNYANTTTYKTLVDKFSRASGGVEATAGMWRSTAAITSVTFGMTSGSLLAGSIFTLYGILAA
jgi:hypothetical protein